MHEAMAATLDTAVEQIKKIQQDARVNGNAVRPRWPMIVLNSPKGWTGPKVVDGLQIEGTFRAHQVPLSDPATHPEHLKLLEDWLRSYRPEELFDEQGRLKPELAELAPKGERRMGANPHANGGILLRDLRMPDFRDYAVDVPSPGVRGIGDTHVLGRFLRDVAKLNSEQRNFRVFGPDETLSNGLEALFEATQRQWDAATAPNDEFLAPTGRVMEMLSEHQCEGWLEGYLLTGRHGLFNCYEAFIHIVDSMFNQHAKWLKVTSHIPWRRKIASLNYLLASHVWRQDHNGFTHQDPGFIDLVMNKKAEIVRLSAAGCQLPVVGDGPLPAQPPLRQRHRRQAPRAAVVDDGHDRRLFRGHQRSGSGPATIKVSPRATIPQNMSYEFRATPEDRTKSTSLWLGSGMKMSAPVLPKLKYFEGMKMMNGMMKMNGDMKMMEGMEMSNQTMDMNTVMYPEITGDTKDNMQNMNGSEQKKDSMPGMKMSSTDNMQGMNMGNSSDIVTLNYNMLRSPVKTILPDGPTKVLHFNLTGNMNRYVWTIDNKTVTESDKILIKQGENVRIILTNMSMMRHPMHLHGHDFRVLNGQGDYAPLKNVIDIMPMETDTIEFAATQSGNWFFHCHILYHMMAGMGRVFTYENSPVNPELPDASKAYRMFKKDNRMIHPMAKIGLESNGSDGVAMLSTTRYALQQLWHLGYHDEHGYESETNFGRYFGKNQWLFPYVGFDYHYKKGRYVF